MPFSPLFARRDVIRIGAVSLFASPLARAATVPGERKPSASSCIYILLQGGPSHIDLWDPKPNAPAEVRGPFSPIETRTAGIHVGELMSQTARVSEHLALVRSMEHRFANHIAGTYIMLTGSTNQPDADREAKAEDFPGPGAVLNWLDRSPRGVPVSVSLPNWLSIPGPSNRMPGQYAGLLGSAHDPFLIEGDPSKTNFQPLELSLAGEVGTDRFSHRVGLLERMDDAIRHLENEAVRTRDRMYETAYEMLTDPRVRVAVDLSREPDRTRERYGRTKLGQSLLLARRLVEAGVTFVGVNEFNQAWDHHANVRDTLRDRVPRMDQATSALISDLAERGLLPETLVIHTGEFGRTPTLNKDGGRDHWPFAFTTALAGGGIRGGQVYGQSDSKGAYVAANPVSPADLLATMWHCLGIDPGLELSDRLGRPFALSTGSVVEGLLA